LIGPLSALRCPLAPTRTPPPTTGAVSIFCLAASTSLPAPPFSTFLAMRLPVAIHRLELFIRKWPLELFLQRVQCRRSRRAPRPTCDEETKRPVELRKLDLGQRPSELLRQSQPRDADVPLRLFFDIVLNLDVAIAHGDVIRQSAVRSADVGRHELLEI
jgi:hypothetical protein